MFYIQSSVADPGPGDFLDPGSRIRDGKNAHLGPGLNISDHIPESLVSIFRLKMLQFFVADPDPGPGAFLSWIRVQNGKIRIRDKHPGSATLLQSVTLIINLLNFNFLVKI